MSDSLDPKVWWERAMQDFRLAELGFQDDSSTLEEAICASCHEACERMLKAYLLATGWELVHSHGLRALGKEASKTLPEIAPLIPELAQLDAEFVANRSPNGHVEDSDEMDAQRAFSIKKRLRDVLADRL